MLMQPLLIHFQGRREEHSRAKADGDTLFTYIYARSIDARARASNVADDDDDDGDTGKVFSD